MFFHFSFTATSNFFFYLLQKIVMESFRWHHSGKVMRLVWEKSIRFPYKEPVNNWEPEVCTCFFVSLFLAVWHTHTHTHPSLCGSLFSSTGWRAWCPFLTRATAFEVGNDSKDTIPLFLSLSCLSTWTNIHYYVT